MAVELFANLPSTVVTSGGTDAPVSGTVETWTVASSSAFPAASSSGTPPGQFHVADIASNSELILVTNVSGTTWTVTRGSEGTTPVTHVAGFAIFQVTTAGALAQLRTADWINVVTMYGADPTGQSDSTTAFQNALAAAGSNAQYASDNPMGGGWVYVPWGAYLISGPLNVPPHVYMVGEVAMTLPLAAFDVQYSGSRLVASSSWAPSSTTGVVQFLSKTPGGWAKNMEQAGLRGIVIDCSQNTSTNLSGILNTGPVYDIHLQDVFVNTAGHNGIHATTQTESGIGPALPYHHYYERVTCYNCVNTGFNVANFTDSTFSQCMSFGAGGSGWVLAGMQDCIFTACRGQWSTANGFILTATGGHVIFTGCETDNNGQSGLVINSASGTGGAITVSGWISESDGRASSAAALYIHGCATPVVVTGFTQGMDTVSGTGAPVYGLEVGSNTAPVLISDSYFEGSTSALKDDGSNTNLILDTVVLGTGSVGSLTYATRAETPGAYLCAPSSYAPSGQVILACTSTTLTAVSALGTTVASGSNGGEISTIASWSSPSAGVLDVASTTGWPSSGTVNVAASGATTAVVTYTGTAAGQLTGCAYVSGSATGTVATGGAVTLTSATVATGSFPGPQSGSVLVTAMFTGQYSTTTNSVAFGLLGHGTNTLYGNLIAHSVAQTGIRFPETLQFIVSGLTPSTSYNFDLAAAVQSGQTYSIYAFANATTTPTLTGANAGSPVIMTVQVT